MGEAVATCVGVTVAIAVLGREGGVHRKLGPAAADYLQAAPQEWAEQADKGRPISHVGGVAACLSCRPMQVQLRPFNFAEAVARAGLTPTGQPISPKPEVKAPSLATP